MQTGVALSGVNVIESLISIQMYNVLLWLFQLNVANKSTNNLDSLTHHCKFIDQCPILKLTPVNYHCYIPQWVVGTQKRADKNNFNPGKNNSPIELKT